jgi:DNA-binding NtrC family response regulator
MSAFSNPISDPPAYVLAVNLLWHDRECLRGILQPAGWHLKSAPKIETVFQSMEQAVLPVLICEVDLPDGTWRGLLHRAEQFPRPPRVVVASRLADERLWAEVLNLGGFDVLSTPFEASEVRHVVAHAWASWQSQWRSGSGSRLAASSRRVVPAVA